MYFNDNDNNNVNGRANNNFLIYLSQILFQKHNCVLQCRALLNHSECHCGQAF